MRVLCVYHALPRSVLTGCPDSLHSPPPLQLASVMLLEPFQNFYHEPPPALLHRDYPGDSPCTSTRVTRACHGNQDSPLT